MKRTVTTTERETIRLEDLTNNSHVGFAIKGYDKHYIIAIDKNKFTCVSIGDGNKNCNIYAEDIFDTLLEKVKDVLEDCYVLETFVFDTRRELYQWLASDEN